MAAGAVAVLTDPGGRAAAAATGLPVLVVPTPRPCSGRSPPGCTAGRPTTSAARRHRHQRQDHHRVPARGRPAGRRPHHRAGRRRRDPRRRRCASSAAAPRPRRPSCTALFALMRERGVTAAAMEVSSHALALGRVDGIGFDVGAVHQPVAGPPGLPRRHGRLLRGQGAGCSARAGRASAWSTSTTPTAGELRRVAKVADDHVLRAGGAATPTGGRSTCGWAPTAARSAWSARRRRGRRAGARCPARSTSPTRSARSSRWSRPGVAAAGRGAGVGALPGVPGRMERVDGRPAVPGRRRLRAQAGRGRVACCAAARRSPRGRLIVVLGCGGDRDRGQAAADGRGRGAAAPTWPCSPATTRAPRTRWPSSPRWSTGRSRVPRHDRAQVIVEPDRARRDRRWRSAGPRPRRRVVVAGKGHEQGQDIAGVVLPFDDRDRSPRRSAHAAARREARVIPLTLAESPTITGGRCSGMADPRAVVDRPSSIDSRDAEPGSLFVACTGERVDGHDFAAAAVAAGAVAVLATRPVEAPAVIVADAAGRARPAGPRRRRAAARARRDRRHRLGRQDHHQGPARPAARAGSGPTVAPPARSTTRSASR